MDVARQNRRAVFTDLDGTLLGPDQKLCDRNRATLEHLNSLGVTRVVVTGRSLFSCDRVLDDTFPIDLLVTSSGAGIFSFKPKTLLQQFALDNTEMARAIDVLEQMKLDFMVHNAVPDNHRFHWRRFGRANPDFDRRLSLYAGHHQMLEQELTTMGDAAQLLAIAASEDPTSLHEELARYLPNLNIVRTTSPLDHCSVWYEIFPKTVGKSHAAQWVCDHFELDAATALAVGNDFNDVDMLRWASVARVVANAPEPLVREFRSVADHSESGFSDAVAEWLANSA
ncbi:MAG: HAD family hydrolase [Arenicellales bacterium]|mgnify:FL=1